MYGRANVDLLRARLGTSFPALPALIAVTGPRSWCGVGSHRLRTPQNTAGDVRIGGGDRQLLATELALEPSQQTVKSAPSANRSLQRPRFGRRQLRWTSVFPCDA